MARKFQQGIYSPKNPSKYLGKKAPRYRSGWELVVFRMCDNHPSILGWGSETHRIPYKNPITGKNTTYVPDLLMVYNDRLGRKHAELVEIKPAGQTLSEAKSLQQKAAAVVNQAKWEAARAWCKSNQLGFRILTENEIFNKPQKTNRKKK